MKAFSSNEPSKDSATTDRSETETGKIIIVKTSLFTFYQFLLQAPGERHIKLWVSCGFFSIPTLYRHYNLDICVRMVFSRNGQW